MPQPTSRRHLPLVAITAVAGAALLTGAALSITGANIRNGTVTSADVKNGSLTSADVKNKSLTGSDIKDGSITSSDLKPGLVPGAVPGPAGPTGATGATGATGETGPVGAAGSAKAWGAFAMPLTAGGAPVAGSSPVLSTKSSPNVTGVTTSLFSSPGVYCLTVTGHTPANSVIVATVDLSTSDANPASTALVQTGKAGICAANQFRIDVTSYQREEVTISGSTMNVMLEPVEAADVGVVFAIY